MAAEIAEVAKLDVEPGTLPETMAAWVIRAEREGEPKDAFQVEEIEVPEPGAFEVIVRVMAAGVNFNNVWAALGKPVSVFGYGDHPEYGHHIGGSDASGIVWKVGAGVTNWKPGDEVVVHCNQASYEDVEVHGLDPMAAPSQKIWGYETTWGSFAQFTKVQAQQLLPKPENLSWVDCSRLRADLLHRLPDADHRAKIQAGHNVLIWGAAGGLGVFATQLCKAAGANAVGVVSSAEKGELVKQLGAVDYINRNEFAGMMRTGDESAGGGEGPLQGVPRLRQAGQGDPRRRARHRLRARRPGDLPDLGLHGQAVRQGRDLRRHLRLHARLRRPLPVDEAEGDPRIALRQRLRVHARQPAHGRGQDPPGALEVDGLRGRPRGASADAREQALRARSRSGSAPPTTSRARPPRAKAPSGPRSERSRLRGQRAPGRIGNRAQSAANSHISAHLIGARNTAVTGAFDRPLGTGAKWQRRLQECRFAFESDAFCFHAKGDASSTWGSLKPSGGRGEAVRSRPGCP